MAPPIILLSGWAVPVKCLAPLANAVRDRVGVAPDLYEFAGTSFAAALADRLRACSEPPDVIGWSTGGLIALETACRSPGLIRRLVLLSSTACFCAQQNYPHGPPIAGLRAMMRDVRADSIEQTLTVFFHAAAKPDHVDPHETKQRVQDAREQGPDTLYEGLRYLRNTDVQPALSALSIPTLVIHGAEDRIIPVGAAEWLAANISTATLITLEGRGHDIPLHRPSDLAGPIANFLQRNVN